MNIRTILFPTDFSSCANAAIAYAAHFARQHGAMIICLHVIEPLATTVSYAGFSEALPDTDISDHLEETAERELPSIADCKEFEGLTVDELVVHGDAAAEIVRVSVERQVDLIVLASHGRTGLGRILFGSTAEEVVRHAICPVLVVKQPAGE